MSPSPSPISESQLNANRENAKKSTGPRTAEGKSRTRLNGLRHGLTGQTAFLPEEDRAAYHRHHADFRAELKPLGLIETQLAHQLADDYWRLNRLKAIETNIFALGIEAHAEELEDDALSQAQTYLDHARELNLLSIYEQRLNRAINSRHQQLRNLRELRREEENVLAFRKRYGLSTSQDEPQTKSANQADAQPERGGQGFGFSNQPGEPETHIDNTGQSINFLNLPDPGTGFPARIYPSQLPRTGQIAANAPQSV
jgi:hypothetical protein